MMKKNIFLAILILAISLQTKAQDKTQLGVSYNAYELGLLKMQWFRSTNTSGFGLDSILQTSLVELGYHTQKGDLHRVQEVGKKRATKFEAQRFMSVGNYYLYGNFNFEQSRGHDKSWADVTDPYHSGPMIFGSSIKAPYDWQSFGLSVKLGSRKQTRLMHGISMDYQVGELSRQRDPRSLTDFVDYAITPAISYQVADNTRLGVNIVYRFKKESMQSIKTIQDNPMVSYYLFSGMDNYKVLLGQSNYGSFSRYFVNNYWGGDMQIQQHIGYHSKLLLAGGFTKMNQAVEGGKYREKPGNFDQNKFKASADLLIEATGGIHRLSLEGNYVNSGSDENIQELSVTTNPETKEVTTKWVTLYTYQNRFVSDAINLKASYVYHHLKANNKTEYRWLAGAGVEYDHFNKEYRIPNSAIAATRLSVHIDGAYQVDLKNSKNIHFSLQMGYAPSLKTKMEGLQDNDFTNSVLKPDFENYYKKDFAQARVNIRYETPVNIKASKIIIYANAYAQNWMSVQTKREHLSSFGLSFGIFTK